MFGINIKNKKQSDPYISCDHINRQLYFFDKKVSYCSIGNRANNREYPVLFSYDGGNIDINKLFKKRNNDKNNIKKGNMIEACKNCSYLQKDIWDEKIKKNQLEYIQFSDWSLCNSKCIYCGSWNNTVVSNGEYTTKDGKPDTYPIVPIIKTMIKKKIVTKDTVFNFAGGEPTLYFQFEEALNLLINFGIQKFDVYSNIIIYSKAIESAITKGVLNLTVSIDAGSKEMHEKVKGVNSYDAVWENFEKYSKAKQSGLNNKVISKYVIVPGVNDLENEIEEWLKKSCSIGITDFILNVDNRIYENGSPSDEVLARLKKLTDFFVNLAQKCDCNYVLDPNISYFNN